MKNRLLLDNISNIYKKMSHAAMRAGRNPEDVRLIAVTKTVSAERILMGIDCGLRTFGENRVQEAQKKIDDPVLKIPHCKLEWHMIGHLQKNKVKYAVKLFDLIHSVDSIELAAEIDSHAGRLGKTQKVLVEVKLSGEASKHGVSRADLTRILEAVACLKHLKLKGLMTVPPFFDDPEETRPYFRELRELRDEAVSEGFRLPELSMGMSGDFEVAIQEGATMVRIGTAIFGERG